MADPSTSDLIAGITQLLPPQQLTSGGAVADDLLQYDGAKWVPSDVLSEIDPRLITTPEEFGAVGDGVTDDSAAFTAWFAADGIHIAPPGRTYLVAGVFTISTDKAEYNFGTSTLKCKNSSTTGFVVTGDNVVLRNLGFNGNRTGTSVVSQGIEWRGVGGRCENVESSSHNDCEGGFSLITGTPDLTCVNCSAHVNGDRAVDDSPATLRVTSYSSTAYGVDGFSCNAGTLKLIDCYAHYNSRSGVFIGKDAQDGCYVDVEANGNFSGLIRSSGDHTNKADNTYNGTTGAVTVRSNNGTIHRCIMDGTDENGDSATRYGLVAGPNGGTGPLGEDWKIGYVSGSNFEWVFPVMTPTSAADVMHLRGGHNNEVDTLYCNNVTGYGLVIGGGANNVSFDNAIPADHYVGTLYARYVRNPPLVCSSGRRIHIGTITCVDSAPVSIGEGSASVIENIRVDSLTAFRSTTGVFVNGGMDVGGVMQLIDIGEINCYDCDLTGVTSVFQTALVSLFGGPTKINRVTSKTRFGETQPDYVVSVDDEILTGTSFTHTVEEIDCTDFAIALTLTGGGSGLQCGPTFVDATAATIPGVIVKKIEMFDAYGNSHGFVPVYDTIT